MIDNVLNQQCIIALDTADERKLNSLLDSIKDDFSWVKVGMELYFKLGPTILTTLNDRGFKIFLDLKLYDIPQTIHNALTSLSEHPFDLITIHLQGGNAMIKAASDALIEKKHNGKLLGVSVLTSFSEEDWKLTQYGSTTIKDSVLTLVSLTHCNLLHGIVCSSHEIKDLKNVTKLKTIVPGIRWHKGNDDQKRVMTPAQALTLGANYLVIGREITKADNITLAIKSLKDHLHEQYIK